MFLFLTPTVNENPSFTVSLTVQSIFSYLFVPDLRYNLCILTLISLTISKIAYFPTDVFIRCLKYLIGSFAYLLMRSVYRSLSTNINFSVKKPCCWSNWPTSPRHSLVTLFYFFPSTCLCMKLQCSFNNFYLCPSPQHSFTSMRRP